jgi:hypothetical protein
VLVGKLLEKNMKKIVSPLKSLKKGVGSHNDIKYETKKETMGICEHFAILQPPLA